MIKYKLKVRSIDLQKNHCKICEKQHFSFVFLPKSSFFWGIIKKKQWRTLQRETKSLFCWKSEKV